ncbi:MAG: RNA polymerase subunit sigma-70 [Chloroflexi bacterium RBG_16_68_14]|nr:MAG: RNA polymerase subunit sigma-70 [Chloroflexi bacterium RBG_16_68_14]
MNRVETFSQHQPLLFAIAYRMLSSAMDAEDMVQETFLRWQAVGAEEVRSPKSYLSTIVTRLCIDRLRSARAQREEYIGPWLPEPLIAEETTDMTEQLALADSLSIAFLVLLENLSPVERAVFLLRDVFEYDYAEIARIADKSEVNCRQIARRARRHLAAREHRFDASSEEVERITRRFVLAATNGDIAGLLGLLADDATLWSDGGGQVASAINPVYGAMNIARFFIGLAKKTPPGFAARVASVNGQPGIVTYVNSQPESVITGEIAGGRIRAIHIVRNPGKLQRVPPLKADA